MSSQFIRSSDFKKLRINSGISRKELSDSIGVSAPTIQKWEESEDSIKLSVEQFQTFMKLVSDPEEQQKIDDLFKEINDFWRSKVSTCDNDGL